MLTGQLDSATLLAQEDYRSSYQDYKPDTAGLAPLQQVSEPTELLVIQGTWCPDCVREVPRLIRIAEQLNGTVFKLSHIGVDRDKTDPAGLAGRYDFNRIPTILVLRQGVELGRIVERPQTSLEQDLVDILGL
ncbi:TlpA family protein disulfide reductase [Shewanella sedimentimangrovi]|uniref:Thioredoxin family protein n=1 Tax=Shewanella sedimentimangrovi TaxID=2814293 RepID=A0ABX7R116_9GAMM|nr:thioredoxin family protein [Shewanella sedimentimangrovi]QSX36895.1 thioredoxin family protein [Shewanella sedimentimangrovi]